MIDTPRGNRIHIGVAGSRNAGKSSLINAITGQQAALVSETKGTTTDPVYKAMELLPIGPVMLVDTAGIDDEGDLGKLRVNKTEEVLNKMDAILYVIDGSAEVITEEDKIFLSRIHQRKTKCIGVLNKADQIMDARQTAEKWGREYNIPFVAVSALMNENIDTLKEEIIQMCSVLQKTTFILDGLVGEGSKIVLVMPIDEAAPKGRIILPQQQVLRSILDANGMAVCVQPQELEQVLQVLHGIDLVITDSQVLDVVDRIVPETIQLTSFSILFAKIKGELREMLVNIQAVKELKQNAHVLICEACTHHRQKNDIGTVKIPGWMRNYIGEQLEFTHSAGGSFPENLKLFDLIVHCGSCMITDTEMHYRMEQARKAGVPLVNYGMMIGLMNGTLNRAIKPFLSEDKFCIN